MREELHKVFKIKLFCNIELSPAFRILNRTSESVFKSERVFCDFRNSILTSFFCNFRKVWNRTNSKLSINSECLETPVFDPNTLKNRVFWPKNRVFDPKTGNYFQTYFWTIFAKFLRVRKDQIFPKNFRTSITELFRNLRKQKLGKFHLSQGLILNYILSLKT